MNTIDILTRMIQKHDIQANWDKIPDFIPMLAEIIVYDPDDYCSHARLKIGDGKTTITSLPFIDEIIDISSSQVIYQGDLLTNIINNYILDIDYESYLSFNTDEIIINNDTTSVLGQAILGQLILA